MRHYAGFRALKGVEKVSRDDLFLWHGISTQGHENKLKENRYLKDNKEYSSYIDIWDARRSQNKESSTPKY